MSVSTAAERLAIVMEGLDRACTQAGRPISDVQLLAVTKTRPAAAVRELYDLGLRAFGENRVGEAIQKCPLLPSDSQWHMIGHLQTNKAKDCLGFLWLHSLERVETARALEKVFAREDRTLNVLLEANTGGEAAKDGVPTLDDLKRLAGHVAEFPHLKIRGLMTMAPFSPDEAVVRPCFERLRYWRDALAAEFPSQDWTTLSMGMTNDYRWAIAEGSTMVRIGTALFEGFR
jgi:pyridoxal phosphate enzyme (YggS family)